MSAPHSECVLPVGTRWYGLTAIARPGSSFWPSPRDCGGSPARASNITRSEPADAVMFGSLRPTGSTGSARDSDRGFEHADEDVGEVLDEGGLVELGFARVRLDHAGALRHRHRHEHDHLDDPLAPHRCGQLRRTGLEQLEDLA